MSLSAVMMAAVFDHCMIVAVAAAVDLSQEAHILPAVEVVAAAVVGVHHIALALEVSVPV